MTMSRFVIDILIKSKNHNNSSKSNIPDQNITLLGDKNIKLDIHSKKSKPQIVKLHEGRFEL